MRLLCVCFLCLCCLMFISVPTFGGPDHDVKAALALASSPSKVPADKVTCRCGNGCFSPDCPGGNGCHCASVKEKTKTRGPTRPAPAGDGWQWSEEEKCWWRWKQRPVTVLPPVVPYVQAQQLPSFQPAMSSPSFVPTFAPTMAPMPAPAYAPQFIPMMGNSFAGRGFSSFGGGGGMNCSRGG